jgi:hypothetical protein
VSINRNDLSRRKLQFSAPSRNIERVSPRANGHDHPVSCMRCGSALTTRSRGLFCMSRIYLKVPALTNCCEPTVDQAIHFPRFRSIVRQRIARRARDAVSFVRIVRVLFVQNPAGPFRAQPSASQCFCRYLRRPSAAARVESSALQREFAYLLKSRDASEDAFQQECPTPTHAVPPSIEST